MLDKIKALMDMQKKIQAVKAELDRTDFQVRSSDGLVAVTMNGSQNVRRIELADGFRDAAPQRLQEALADAVNRAIKRSQELAAQKMKETTGLNLPGL